MKNKTKSILIFLFLISINLTQIDANESRFSFKVSSIRQFDIENPSLGFYLDYLLIPSVSYEIGGGILIPKSLLTYALELISNGDLYPSHKGYRLESTVKYWLGENGFTSDDKAFYLGLNPFFIKNEYNCSDGFYDSDTTTPVFDRTQNWFDVYKELYGINLLFGIQKSSGRARISTTWGLGAIHRYVQQFNKTRTLYSEYGFNMLDYPSNGWYLNFHIDLSVGFVF